MKVSHFAPFALAAFLATVSRATPTTAADLGVGITDSDKNFASTPSSYTPAQTFSKWYANHEDNETENNPQTVMGQDWDLEGMYLNGTALTMVGGFDFKNGNKYPATNAGYLYKTGDIFIDVNGDAKYGYTDNNGSGLSGNVNNTFGYDYAIHFNLNATTKAVESYSVFGLTPQTTVTRVLDVPSSNPWVYVSGGTAVTGFQNLSVGTSNYGLLSSTVYSQLNTYGSPSTGLQGYNGNNNHYYLTVDTSFLPATTQATFHYTMECGNDNLIGRAAIVNAPDGGSTAALLSLVLIPLCVYRRKARS